MNVTRVLITGSTTGLGKAAAQQLLDEGHDVVLHARNANRAAAVEDLARRAAGIVTGDLAVAAETRRAADQANAIGRIDAVIHNAGIYTDPHRIATPEGHARTLAVNVLAPYLLTAWIEGPARLVYLSSDMHHSGDTSLRDIDWTERRWNGVQAYCDSKLYVTTLALTLARRWPDRCVHVVDPGWVPTRMGGPGAPDDLELGHRTQTWLAVGDDCPSAGYWYHQQQQRPAAAALDTARSRRVVGSEPSDIGARGASTIDWRSSFWGRPGRAEVGPLGAPRHRAIWARNGTAAARCRPLGLALAFGVVVPPWHDARCGGGWTTVSVPGEQLPDAAIVAVAGAP